MGITYIVGARQSGKTTALTKFIDNPHTIWFAPTIAMLRGIRHVNVTKRPAHPDTALLALNYETVLCDEFTKFSWQVQYRLLSEALNHYNLVVTISPELILKRTPPPYWDYWDRAKIINLQSRSSQEAIREYERMLPPEAVITEVWGKFIVDPKE